MELWLIGFVVVLMVVSALLSARARARIDQSWRSFAATRQLGFDGKQIAGVVSGCTVALLREERGQGRSRRTVAVVRCSLMGALPDTFLLEKESLGDKVMHLLNHHDHQLGYPELDAAFHLRGVDDRVRRVFADSSAQLVMLTACRSYPEMRIGKGVVQLEVQPVPKSEEALNLFLSDAISVAQALRKAASR